MPLSLIILLAVGTILLFIVFIPVLIFIKTNANKSTPLKISYWFIGILLLNWVLFLTDSYTLLPVKIADLIFVPIWWVLCFIGIIIGIIEFKNNKIFALSIAGLTTISFIFSWMAYGMSKM